MSRGVRWFLISSAALLTLAGCGRGFMQYGGEREPWRREAEVACLNSGTVKENPGIVKISPIDGPGMCGAAFPLKVSAFGEGPALGYIEEPVRPPGSIAGASPSQPRWPISQQQQPQYAVQQQPPQPQPYGTTGNASPTLATGDVFNLHVQGLNDTDRNLAQNILQGLRTDSLLHSLLPTVNINVSGGRVILQGTVQSEQQRRAGRVE